MSAPNLNLPLECGAGIPPASVLSFTWPSYDHTPPRPNQFSTVEELFDRINLKADSRAPIRDLSSGCFLFSNSWGSSFNSGSFWAVFIFSFLYPILYWDNDRDGYSLACSLLSLFLCSLFSFSKGTLLYQISTWYVIIKHNNHAERCFCRKIVYH